MAAAAQETSLANLPARYLAVGSRATAAVADMVVAPATSSASSQDRCLEVESKVTDRLDSNNMAVAPATLRLVVVVLEAC
jgi:hypothetical protein